MKKIKWVVFPILIGLCVLCILPLLFLTIVGLDFLGGLTDFFETPLQDSRQIVTSTSFETVWEKPIISIPNPTDNGKYRGDQVFLLVQDNQVIMPRFNTSGLLSTGMILSSFDIETGQTVWETSYSRKLDHIGSNSKNIYLLGANYDPTPPEEILDSCEAVLPTCNSIKILAIDRLTGKELWVADYPNTLHIDKFTINDDAINIEGSSGYSLFVPEFSIDANTGEKLAEFQGLTYPADDSSNKDIAESLGFGGVVSNYADNGNYIFYLSKAGNNLWALDKETLEIAGQVQFDGPQFETLLEQRSRGFAVESNDNKIIIYLGDSGQLFVLKFTPPE